MSSETSQQFCVRWNSHLGSLGAAFPQLLAGQRFVDVTLACEGHQLHCHRLVLAACSTYFESLLGENPCKHPIIILPRDIKLWEIQALVDFMYKGEVNVSQAGLSDLLKCAEILQIRGLCGSDAALNLNQVNAASVQSTSPQTSSILSTLLPSNSNLSTSPTPSSSILPEDCVASQIPSQQQSSPIQSTANNDRLENVSPVNASNSKTGSDPAKNTNAGNGNHSKKNYSRVENHLSSKSLKNERTSSKDQKQSEIRVVDKVEPLDMSIEEETDDQEFSQTNEKTSEGESYSTKYVDYLEGSKGESRHHLIQTQQQEQFEYEGTLSKRRSSAQSKETTPLELRSASSAKDHCVDITDDTHHDVYNSENRESYYDEVGDIYIINDVDEDACQRLRERRSQSRGQNRHLTASTHHDLNSSKNLRQMRTSDTIITRRNNCRGKIRVKSNENLFDNFGNNKKTDQIQDLNSHEKTPRRMERINYDYSQPATPSSRGVRRSLPGALRFNRNSMTVFLKPAREPQNPMNYSEEYQQSNENGESVFVTTTIKSEPELVEDNYENIVCLPNVMEMYNGNDDITVTGEDITLMNVDSDHFNVHDQFDPSVHAGETSEYEDIKIDNEVIYAERIHSSGLLHYSNASESHSDEGASHHFNELEITESNKRPMDFAMAQFLSDHIVGHIDNKAGDSRRLEVPMGQRPSYASSVGGRRCRYVTNNRSTAMVHNKIPVDTEPTLSAVVLRNPRSNQPRAYNNDALYAALMDVKSGESIYRASQIHKVPRKTLRNWMKRWHIKSAYPMPRQLKQAAEKKKRIQQQMEKSIKNTNITGTGRNNVVVYNNLNNCSDANVHSQATTGLLQSSHRHNSITKNALKKDVRNMPVCMDKCKMSI